MVVSIDRAKRGTGAIRERLPGVWEIRVVIGFNPIHSRSVRHGVATHLVDGEKLLEAQTRLGHSDPPTTLRHYSHASSLDDEDMADESTQC